VSLADRIEAAAVARMISMNAWMREACVERLAKEEHGKRVAEVEGLRAG
jgi:hypothetical protein